MTLLRSGKSVPVRTGEVMANEEDIIIAQFIIGSHRSNSGLTAGTRLSTHLH